MKCFVFSSGVALFASAASATESNYFPPSFAEKTIGCSFDNRPMKIEVVSELENHWYSGQLAAAKEPSLYVASKARRASGVGTVRFTWLRTFHAPVTVRIEGLGSAAPRLIAKQLSGHGGYAPGTISKTVDRSISAQEATEIELALHRSGIFNSPPKLCDLGLDGSIWIIEAVDDRGYHFIDRFSPTSGSVHDVGIDLMKLTGWDLKPIY